MVAALAPSILTERSTKSISGWNSLLDPMFGARVKPINETTFRASFRTFCALDGFLLAEFNSPGAIVRHLRASTEHHEYLIHVQTRGTSSTRQGRRQATLEPGDMVVLDSTQPYEVEFEEDTTILALHFPQARLLCQWPGLRDQAVQPIVVNKAASGLLLSFVNDFWHHSRANAFGGIEGELTDAMMSLLSLAVRPPRAVLAMDQDIWRRIERFVQANLHHTALSVTEIASHICRSVRTVQGIFAGRQQTVSGYIRNCRLDAAAQCLSHPAHAHRSIMEVGFDFGFNDLSHFTRLFRARFGMPPARYRTAHLL